MNKTRSSLQRQTPTIAHRVTISMGVAISLSVVAVSAQDVSNIQRGWRGSPHGQMLERDLVIATQGLQRLENRLPNLETQIRSLIDDVAALAVVDTPKPPPEESEPRKVPFRPPIEYTSDKTDPMWLYFENGRVTLVHKELMQRYVIHYKTIVESQLNADIALQSRAWTGKLAEDLPQAHFYFEIKLTYEKKAGGRPTGGYELIRKSGGSHAGDTIQQFEQSASEVRRAIEAADVEKVIVKCIVYPDSFDVFRAVRQFIWDRKLEVGWTFYSPTEPLFFIVGSGGYQGDG